MKYSEYRDFRKRLDARECESEAWDDTECSYEAADNDIGMREKFTPVRQCRNYMPVAGASRVQAMIILDQFASEVSETLSACPIFGVIEVAAGENTQTVLEYTFTQEAG